MKTSNYLIVLLGIITLMGCDHSKSENSEFFQLKIYSFDTDEQVATTENYLKDAFIPGIKRLGIESVGVFKSRISEADSIRKIFVLVPFTSFSQFTTLEEELAGDEMYVASGKSYLNANFDQPPYSRIESILLQAFDSMPKIKAPELQGDRANRVYELRSYQSATEAYHNLKVDMFNKGGEIKLFEKLGFNALFYARVISGSKMPNLMYMITFDDEASQKAHWDAFVNSPEWTELKVMPKYLNTVSHIDKTMLYPTDYSDY